MSDLDSYAILGLAFLTQCAWLAHSLAHPVREWLIERNTERFE